MERIDEKKLIKKTLSAMANAYAPYSKFPVGACIVTADGEEITGCNIENASYGLSMCAERVALFKGVLGREKGHRSFGGGCKCR